MTLKTPILLIVFNRPKETQFVFEAISKIKPTRLYVASDGPRIDNDDDVQKISLVRQILSNVDWPCKVFTSFQDHNYGCGSAVKNALDWFFENEEIGIILEDDTIPDLSFFGYCEELLKKYRYDDRIGMIAGTNHVDYDFKENTSYIFSRNKACWGWATWKRSWITMDFEMTWRSSEYSSLIVENMGSSPWYISHWNRALQLIDSKKVSAWDWQWYFSKAAQNQLTIFPSVNLISNIGFGIDATHTKQPSLKQYGLKQSIELPLVHPKIVCPDTNYDYLFEKLKMKRKLYIFRFISHFIKVLRLAVKS